MHRHFTATAFVLKNNRSLLVFHKRLKSWLPPGGHIHPNESPPAAALREVEEETGLKVRILPQENLWLSSPNARSLERPYLCLLESIPATKTEEAHEHIDFIFLTEPISSKEKPNWEEIDEMRWFSLEEIRDLPKEDIFADTKECLEHLLLSKKLSNI